MALRFCSSSYGWPESASVLFFVQTNTFGIWRRTPKWKKTLLSIINATTKIKSECPQAKIVIHSLDAEFINIPQKNLSAYFGFEVEEIIVDIICIDYDKLKMGNTEIQVLHTPGHTPGGACFIVDDAIFSGDTLFEGSCGRTDFPGGDSAIMANSLKKLKNLEGDYWVFPGHGNATTLNNERRYNLYMRTL